MNKKQLTRDQHCDFSIFFFVNIFTSLTIVSVRSNKVRLYTERINPYHRIYSTRIINSKINNNVIVPVFKAENKMHNIIISNQFYNQIYIFLKLESVNFNYFLNIGQYIHRKYSYIQFIVTQEMIMHFFRVRY